MHDIFISFSSADSLVAEAAKHFLESKSIRCWKAPESIVPGQIWEEAITNAIQDCVGMLLIWSSHSQSSPQVSRELSLAANSQKIIVPFRIEAVEPAGTFAYYLTNTHWIDALSPSLEEDLERVTGQIAAILPSIKYAADKKEEGFNIKSNSKSLLDEAKTSLEQEPTSKAQSLDEPRPALVKANYQEHTRKKEEDFPVLIKNNSNISPLASPEKEAHEEEHDFALIWSVVFAAIFLVASLNALKGLLHAFWYVFRKGLGY